MNDDTTGIVFSSEWIAGNGCHVAISVPDMEEALAFYRDVLGFDEVWSHRDRGGRERTTVPGFSGTEQIETRMLACPGGSRVELICQESAAGQGSPVAGSPGLHHISVGVEDVFAAHARLIAAGVRSVSDPHEIADESHPLFGWISSSVTDPWGTRVELLGRNPARVLDTGERPAATQRA